MKGVGTGGEKLPLGLGSRPGENAAPAGKNPPATVTVVVLNFNGLEELPGCLGSLQKSVEKGSGQVEVWLVDNGSSDGSTEWVRQQHPWVKLLENGSNLGFAKGMNRAVAKVRSPYFALLNNDTEVGEGWLAPLVDCLDTEPDVAAVQSRIMLLGRDGIVQSAGGGVTQDGYGYDRGFWRVYQGEFEHSSEVFFVSAGAGLFRRRAWESVGGFDPAFFMYHEDVDWSWRAWLAGWRLLYEPQSVVWHKMGATTSKVLGFSAREVLGERHRLRSALKLGPLRWALSLVVRVLRVRTRGRFATVSRALIWNLSHLPGTLVRRVRAPRKRSRKEVLAKLHSHCRAPDLLATYSPTTARRILSESCLAHLQGRNLVAGESDEGFLGTGWHAPEPAWPGGPAVRWMVDRAELFLLGSPGDRGVEIEVVWPQREGVDAKAGILELRLPAREAREGERLARCETQAFAGETQTISFWLPPLEVKCLFEIRFLFPEPRSLGVAGDLRPIGFGFHAVRLTGQVKDAINGETGT